MIVSVWGRVQEFRGAFFLFLREILLELHKVVESFLANFLKHGLTTF